MIAVAQSSTLDRYSNNFSLFLLLEQFRPSAYPTRLSVTLKDGSVLERLVRHASGSAGNPMSPAQLREKFFDCCEHAKVARAAAEQIAALFDRLGEGGSLAALWPLLRKG